jgi:two-component system, cell cycle response regulator DivK
VADRKVLVIEDNEQNLELVTFLLEEEGFEVRPVRSADELPAALEEPPPDLVLLDMHLPRRDGLSLLGDLRQHPSTTRVPVVALTAHAMRGDKERFLAAGCDGYLSKPIDVGSFVQSVRSFLTTAREPQ